MSTSDHRRSALLIPLFFPADISVERSKQVKLYIEAFTDAVCDAVFVRKRKAPQILVEFSLLKSQPEHKTIQRIIFDKIRKQRGLEQYIHIVSYPFEGNELRPLEFLHSLPTFIALPFDPSFQGDFDAMKPMIPHCPFVQPLYELLTTPFYRALESGERELHPIMFSLGINLRNFSQTNDLSNNATIKGGHKKAKLFVLPFTWRIVGERKMTISSHSNALNSIIEDVIQRYVDELY